MMLIYLNNYAHAQAVVTRRSILLQTPGYEANVMYSLYIFLCPFTLFNSLLVCDCN